jgi:Predicted periplasmic solute-binding protein
MNVSEIAQLLNDSNVISGTVWFKAAYKLYAGSETVKAGTYIFHDGMNNAEIIKMLTSEYLNPKGKITIPEGAKIKLIARLAEKELNLSPSEIISETQNDSLINILGLKGRVSNLEGFLYPDTYYLYKDVSEKTLVEMMFDEFVKKVLNNSDVNGAFEDNPGKLLEVITLASIVQAETGRIQEMPSIAGLYTNRLMKNMKLQADPTIQYVLPGGQRILLNKDYKFESPYNTYLHYGLPPGPVDNPGLDAIKAAVNPEKNDYLFMVADTNKTHRFAKTYQEHLKNISDIRNGGKQK